MDHKQKIRSFIQKNFIIDDESAVFEDGENFFAKGFVSSLFAMRLVNFLEQEFGITVGNDDLDIKNFNTVDNILALLARS